MKFSSKLWMLLLPFGLVALNGCLDSAHSELDEEKEPQFLAGKGRIQGMDYRGAIECFSKALEANPRSGAAHFELALLYDQKEAEPAAAIYHYEKYLKARPNADNAELVKTRIAACKQELARTVSLGPVTQTLQREFEQLTEENKRLKAELEKFQSAYASAVAQLRTVSSQPPAPVPAPRPVQAVSVPSPQNVYRPADTAGPAPPSSPAPREQRTHTVRAGETPSTIARRYGVKLEALMSANPRLEARRMRVGQSLVIPPS